MKNITLQVPEDNKDLFLEPAIDRIPDLLNINRNRIQNYKFEINGIPFKVLREKTREELLHNAVLYTNAVKSLIRNQPESCLCVSHNTRKGLPSQTFQDKLYINEHALDRESIKNIPIIQTGHEPIFYYPGVWIKNHLIQYLAMKLGGIGVNMIVDNDACNRGFIYIPTLSEKPASIRKVALIKNKDNVAYEEIALDDIGMLRQFKDEVISLLRKNVLNENVKIPAEYMQDTFEEFINRIMEYHQRGCVDMVGLLTSARSELEEDFSIANFEVPVSWMCDTDGFYHFFLHILYNADRFLKIYNKKLAEYRSVHKIRSKANPLPELKIIGRFVELPFWVWGKGEQRSKCYMQDDGGFIKITNREDVLCTLKKGEEVEENISRLKKSLEARFKIRPRAITTTMFSRLFFSDLFIHGIGGAKYDKITDEIIKEFFGIDPPAFVTISTNVFLSLERFDLEAGALQVLQHDLKDMRYNPERYASGKVQNDTKFINMVKEKQRLIAEMVVCDKDEKKRCFDQIKELNKLILTKVEGEFQKKQSEISTIHDKLAYNEVVKFREYPICIYPMRVMKDYFLNVFCGV
ncbi:MAG: hypothetical protein KGQ83_03905 [Planctomycetes bacterium]|nr:hypothetical protein [Planctomycetota bacterium]